MTTTQQPAPAAPQPGEPAPAPQTAPAGAPRPGGPPNQGGAPRPGGPPGPGGGPRPGGGYRPGGPRPGGGYRPGGGPRGGRPRGRYGPRRRVCSFCVEHINYIDYKDVDRLRRFISDRAKIEPTRKTGVCAKHQRLLSNAIKRARHLALLPFIPTPSMNLGGYRR